MNAIVTHIKWIMIISGAITCTMIINTINPEMGLQQHFGASTFSGGEDSQIANIVVRGWGFLIALRPFVLSIAIISKSAFILLVLTYGADFLDTAMTAIVFDTIVIGLYLVYLFKSKNSTTANH